MVLNSLGRQTIAQERLGRQAMRQSARRIAGAIGWIVFVTICVGFSLFGGITHGTALVNGTLTPTTWIYLPYVSKQAPLVPTATLTPTATETSTPTPTTIPQGVRILSNHSSYVDSIDYLHIVGEVENNTANHLRFVKIIANVFDSDGHLLDTDFTYIYLDNLPAGNKTCFHILLQKLAAWSYYEFEAPTYWTDGEPLPNLTVMNHSGSYNVTYGWYEIIGQVRNDHGTRVEYVSPVGTAYNTSGMVVGCDFTYVNSTHLDVGQVSSFKLSFSGRNYSDVTSYRLQVDGNPQ
jgi:hypothetical protein